MVCEAKRLKLTVICGKRKVTRTWEFYVGKFGLASAPGRHAYVTLGGYAHSLIWKACSIRYFGHFDQLAI